MRSHFSEKLILILLSIACVLVGEICFSQSAEELFHQGVSSYQKNDLDHAREQFTQSLKLQPNNVQLLYNLGLTEMKAKHPGLALGLWRKALALEPSNDDVSFAIRFAENSQQERLSSRGGDLFESLHRGLLRETSLGNLVMINLFLFAFAGWILIRYFAQRTRSIENEEPSPPTPYVGILFVVLLLASASLLAAKAYDLSLQRATITLEKVEVKTSPDSSAATLFELFEGLEVIVRQSQGDWLQVSYPGGLAGWVPSNSVFVTSGRP